MTRSHFPIFCAACRKILLVPNGTTELPLPWRFQVVGGPKDRAAYCSDACLDKGPPKRVRERMMAMATLRGAKPAFRQGCADAMQGFDVVGTDPDYVKGHAAGMALRVEIEDFQQQLKQARTG